MAPALGPGDVWIGLAPTDAKHAAQSAPPPSYEIRQLDIDRRTRAGFSVASNQVLWFTLHEMQGLVEPVPPSESGWEAAYREVNRRFADALAAAWHEKHAPIVLQDFHLFECGKLLRERVPDAEIALFCHTPFPARLRLPYSTLLGVVLGMLSCDLVGFQTYSDLSAFSGLCSRLLGAHVRMEDVSWNGRLTRLGVFPATVDGNILTEEALHVDDHLPGISEDETVIAWVGRSDPAKNALGAIESLRLLLQADPTLRRRVRLICKIQPSRQESAPYRQYLGEVVAAATRLNAAATIGGWVPVALDMSSERKQALRVLKRADVVFVNSLADGMNLVVQEAAVLSQRSPSIVLSKRTGVHERFGYAAVSFDPAHPVNGAEALRSALQLTPSERARRIASLRTRIRAYPPSAWLEDQLATLRRRAAASDFFERFPTAPRR